MYRGRSRKHRNALVVVALKNISNKSKYNTIHLRERERERERVHYNETELTLLVLNDDDVFASSSAPSMLGSGGGSSGV